VIYGTKIVVLGGHTIDTAYNDLWYSPDGLNWTEDSGTVRFTSREAFSAVFFNDRIRVAGGYNGSQFFNDVWSSPVRPGTSGGPQGRDDAVIQSRDYGVHVSKTIAPQVIKQGTGFQVTIVLANSGLAPIHDIEILDPTLPEFPLTGGRTQDRIPRMMPGESRVISYTASAQKPGSYLFNGTSVLFAGENGNYHLITSDRPSLTVIEPLISVQAPDLLSGIGRIVSGFFPSVFS